MVPKGGGRLSNAITQAFVAMAIPVRKKLPDMRPAALILCLLPALAIAGPAGAADMAIGIAAPLSGPSGRLGDQLRDGAEVAAATAFAGAPSRLEVADDSCSAEGGADAARQLIAAKVRIVVGFLCTDAIEAAMPLLKKAGIPVVTPGVRANSLTDQRHKTGWPVFRIAPRADAESAAVAAILTRAWRDQLFAIVDDGTIYGRDLAESFRLAAELQGLKPVF